MCSEELSSPTYPDLPFPVPVSIPLEQLPREPTAFFQQTYTADISNLYMLELRSSLTGGLPAGNLTLLLCPHQLFSNFGEDCMTL